MAGSTQTLDRPDSAVRRIMQKREDGARLTEEEYRRLDARQSAEAEVGRTGGTVRQSITPRRLTAFQMGERDREQEQEYAAGREGRPAAGMSGPEQATAARAANPGGIDVRSYSGSRYAAPDSPMAARQIAPGAPKVGEPGGGIQVRRYAGSMFPGAEPAVEPVLGEGTGGQSPATQSREASADAILRRRFGKPPNERGAIDISRGAPARPTSPRRIAY